MEKSIAAFEARRQFGKILRDVEARGDQYIVQRHGEPVAAVVPMYLYKQWKKARDEFFAILHEAQQNANMTPEEADALALEAVQAVRAARQS